MSIRYRIQIPLLLVLVSGCSDPVVDQAVDEICGCVTPVIEAAEQAVATLKAGKNQEFKQLMRQMKFKQVKLSNCLARVRTTYQENEADDSFKKAVEKKVKEQCPLPEFGKR